MASTFIRSAARSPLNSLRSYLKPRAARPSSIPSAPPPASASSRASGSRRLSIVSRSPSELGCCSGSLFPLHSAVASARLTSCLSSTSRSCRALSQDGIDGT